MRTEFRFCWMPISSSLTRNCCYWYLVPNGCMFFRVACQRLRESSRFCTISSCGQRRRGFKRDISAGDNFCHFSLLATLPRRRRLRDQNWTATPLSTETNPMMCCCCCCSWCSWWRRAMKDGARCRSARHDVRLSAVLTNRNRNMMYSRSISGCEKLTESSFLTPSPDIRPMRRHFSCSRSSDEMKFMIYYSNHTNNLISFQYFL